MSAPGGDGCPFCTLDENRVVLVADHAYAVRDGYPVAEGHTLVVPKRHVASLFDLPPDQRAALWRLVGKVRALLVERHDPDGFNVGLNDGIAAGQTVMHAHIHVIPRFLGDVPDPRGGVRWVVPAKARYWEDPNG